MYKVLNSLWDNCVTEMVKHAINTVAKRQIDKIKEWEANAPDWNQTEEGTQKYIEMVRNVTGDNNEISENKIIKTIAKETIIEK